MLFLIFIILIFISIYFISIESKELKLLETVTKSYRGTSSERELVLKLLKNKIPAQTIFHDLYIKKWNDTFSQIDLVVPTKVGILVFEVKDLSGWIFGRGNNKEWTQVLAYGKEKHRLYNPILQNQKHIDELKILLNQENVPFFSLIVFYGDCELKEISFIPKETYVVKSTRIIEVINLILRDNESAKYKDKRQILAKLKNAVENGENVKTQIQHIKNINEMLGKDRIFD